MQVLKKTCSEEEFGYALILAVLDGPEKFYRDNGGSFGNMWRYIEEARRKLNDRSNRSRKPRSKVVRQLRNTASKNERTRTAGLAGSDVSSPDQPVLDRVQETGGDLKEAARRIGEYLKEPRV